MEQDGTMKVILTYDSPFLNTDSIVIEYEDVIKSPQYILLLNLLYDKESQLWKLFDVSELAEKDPIDIYQWYIQRQNPNIFKSLTMYKDVYENFCEERDSTYFEFCDAFKNDLLSECKQAFSDDLGLVFFYALKNLLNLNFDKKIYIFSEDYNQFIEEDIQKNFTNYHKKVNYIFGKSFTELLKENQITANSTFIFSDITRIHSLYENDILNYSSVVLAEHYGYNYVDEQFILDFSFYKDNIFKFHLFDNINIRN